MASRHVLAQLKGGPLDGETIRAPLRDDGTNRPAQVIGLPVPVLDEDRELFWWDTANYFALSMPVKVGTERRAAFAYARTLPGYPTLTSDVPPG